MSATDLAGNPASLSRNYNVHWPFTGFLRDPLKNAAPGKDVKADAGPDDNIVFKLGGNRGLDILADNSPSTFSVSPAGYSAKKLLKKAKKRVASHARAAIGDDFDDLKYNAATDGVHDQVEDRQGLEGHVSDAERGPRGQLDPHGGREVRLATRTT